MEESSNVKSVLYDWDGKFLDRQPNQQIEIASDGITWSRMERSVAGKNHQFWVFSKTGQQDMIKEIWTEKYY